LQRREPVGPAQSSENRKQHIYGAPKTCDYVDSLGTQNTGQIENFEEVKEEIEEPEIEYTQYENNDRYMEIALASGAHYNPIIDDDLVPNPKWQT